MSNVMPPFKIGESVCFRKTKTNNEHPRLFVRGLFCEEPGPGQFRKLEASNPRYWTVTVCWFNTEDALLTETLPAEMLRKTCESGEESL